MGNWKMNCDVAIDKGHGMGAIAALLRNRQGQLIEGLAQKVKLASVAQGEALAVRLACAMVHTVNLGLVEIEGECKSVIQLCVSEDAPPWDCGVIIEDIISMATGGGVSFN
ncbi:hypothetical protein ACSBR2_025061 [Camellia fascicularis]